MARGKGEGSVYKAANGLWTVSLELPSYDGKRRRKVIRAATKRAALDKLQGAKADLQERGDLTTNSATTEQWFLTWLGIKASQARPNTVAGYRSVAIKHIIPGIGPKVKLEKVTPAHVRKVHKKILDAGLTSTYALNAHRVMSSAFNAAVNEGLMRRNPAELTPAPRATATQQEALSVPESLALLEATLTSPLGPVWATALLTGARRGEVLGLERDRVTDVLDLSWQLQRIIWAHGCKRSCGRKRGVDCPSRHLDIPADYEYRPIDGGLYLVRPKSRDGWRIIPLVDPLKSILELHLSSHGHDLAFHRDGRPFDPDQVTNAWQDALATVGVEKHVVMHGLRHTAVDLLYMAGVPEDLIREIVGHSSRAMTRRYKTKGNRERLTAAMQQMSALVSFDARTTS